MNTYHNIKLSNVQLSQYFPPDNRSPDDLPRLQSFFERMVKQSEAFGLISAQYETRSFPEAKALGIADFTLLMFRSKFGHGKDAECCWYGGFYGDDRKISVHAEIINPSW